MAACKAFVLLKMRLPRTFGVSRELDCHDLVNAGFGKNGYVVGKFPEPERDSMRDPLTNCTKSFAIRMALKTLKLIGTKSKQFVQ